MKSSTQVVQNLIKPYIDRNAANIAPVETSATAAAAHAAGTQIVYKGVLYDVTADIAQGDTITVGTNITAADPLSSEIQTLSNKAYDEGVKNLLENTYDSGISYGIIWHTNSDKSVTANGTLASGGDASRCIIGTVNLEIGKKYKLSGCPSGGSNSSYFLRLYIGDTVGDREYGDGLEFTATVTTYTVRAVVVASSVNNLTFKPMITVADAPNSDYAHYQPYAKTNAELTVDTEGLSGLVDNAYTNGAVNLLPNTKASAASAGITYTVNDDGTVLVSAGTAASDGSTFPIKSSSDYWKDLPAGKYRLSGAPVGMNPVNIVFNGNIIQTSGNIQFSAYGDMGYGVEFEITDEMVADPNYRVSVFIQVKGNKTVPNMLFKPMITFADILNSDYAHYVPYCKSNRELTEEQYVSDFAGVTSSDNFTDSVSVTIPSDGVYFLTVQNNVTDSGHTLAIRLNSNSGSANLFLHRTSGQQYESANGVLPLKKGTVIYFICSDATVSCQYAYKKLI